MGETDGTTMSYLPAVIEADCPVCRENRELVGYVQEPLLRHGGYGQAQAYEFEVCSCGVRLVAVRSVKPVSL